MARRKRLGPASIQAEFETETGSIPAVRDELTPAPEVKSMAVKPAAAGFGAPPPISQVVAESATRAALEEVSEALARARAEGRLVLRLALDDIDSDHLVRDRIGLDEDELQSLIGSIREHGQRSPIEVTELPSGRYGLISGWRRLTALRRLQAETGAPSFAQVLALVRQPDTAADAYIAMVEENEIRLGLSYYERARIAARAVEQGVFDTERLALQRLFSNASRARRSKIGSFLTLYHKLDAVLRFPEAIPERLGLALVKLIETSHDAMLETVFDAFRRDPAPDAASEIARLQALVADAAPDEENVSHAKQPAPVDEAPAPDPAAKSGKAQKAATELRPGVFLHISGGFSRPILTISGPGVDPVFRERLEAWLETGA